MLAVPTGDQIFIAAAGHTGTEHISLQINGNTVQTWNNVSGNVANREFLGFTYTAIGTVDPKSVRVVFDNDLYTPGGVDRNLIVDYVRIGENIAIEFDTFEGSNDINSNHIAVSLNGQTFNTWSSTGASFDLNSGTTYYAWVDYNGGSSKLAVYLSDAPTKPSGALLVSFLDVPFFAGDYQNTGRRTYFGFTAGTGEFTNQHQVLSWNLDTGTPPADPPLLQTGNVNAVTIASGLNLPTAMDWINGIASPVTLIAEKGGVVKSMIGGVVQPTPFIDISSIVNEAGDRGLIDIAVHPDFVNNPYVYLYYTYDPPQTHDYANDPFAGPDRPGNRAARLVRVTADATTGYRTAVAGSDVVLLGKNSTWPNFNGFVNSTIDIF